MAVRFASGLSKAHEGAHRIVSQRRGSNSEPPTKSIGPSGISKQTPKNGNTMNGMPGHINAHEPTDMGHAKGGKGAGPHREGYIGERGGKGIKGRDAWASRAPGTTEKSYRKVSTGKAGTYKRTDYIGGRHVHTKNRGKVGEGASHADKPHAVAQGKIAGSGIGHTKAPFGSGVGQRGKMEFLRGRAKTSSERVAKGSAHSRKSVMY